MSMLGLRIPDSGTITILGYDVFREPIKLKEKIGFLPENATFMRNLLLGAT